MQEYVLRLDPFMCLNRKKTMPKKSASSITNKAEATIKPGRKLPAKAIYNLIQIVALPESSPLSTGYVLNDVNAEIRLWTFNGHKLIRQHSFEQDIMSIDPFVSLTIDEHQMTIASLL